jgi:hypothetical protein
MSVQMASCVQLQRLGLNARLSVVCRRVALNLIQSGRQHYMEAWNSPLSEAAVLGFEYGFSLGCRVTSFSLFEGPLTTVIHPIATVWVANACCRLVRVVYVLSALLS